MTHGDGGKGDKQRPTNHEKYGSNYDNIFRRKQEDARAEDEEFERIQREQGEKK